MGFPTQARLLNLLGLLSAGVLLANPELVNAQAGKQNANVVQAVAEMPAAPPATDAEATIEKSDPAAAVRKPTIVDRASDSADFKTLTAALKAAGLTDALSADGPFTVFAPTEAAFNALPDGVLETLLKPENKDILVKILTYHVVPGKLTAADLKSGPVKSLEGSPIALQVGEAAAAPSATSDVPETLETPETVEPMPDDSQMDDAATPPSVPNAADLATPDTEKSDTETSDPETAEAAPTEKMPPETASANDAAPVMVNQAKVKIVDVEASNGVIHGIDQVILPPEIVEKLQQVPASAAPADNASPAPTEKAAPSSVMPLPAP